MKYYHNLDELFAELSLQDEAALSPIITTIVDIAHPNAPVIPGADLRWTKDEHKERIKNAIAVLKAVNSQLAEVLEEDIIEAKATLSRYRNKLADAINEPLQLGKLNNALEKLEIKFPYTEQKAQYLCKSKTLFIRQFKNLYTYFYGQPPWQEETKPPEPNDSDNEQKAMPLESQSGYQFYIIHKKAMQRGWYHFFIKNKFANIASIIIGANYVDYLTEWENIQISSSVNSNNNNGMFSDKELKKCLEEYNELLAKHNLTHQTINAHQDEIEENCNQEIDKIYTNLKNCKWYHRLFNTSLAKKCYLAYAVFGKEFFIDFTKKNVDLDYKQLKQASEPVNELKYLKSEFIHTNYQLIKANISMLMDCRKSNDIDYYNFFIVLYDGFAKVLGNKFEAMEYIKFYIENPTEQDFFDQAIDAVAHIINTVSMDSKFPFIEIKSCYNIAAGSAFCNGNIPDVLYNATSKWRSKTDLQILVKNHIYNLHNMKESTVTSAGEQIAEQTNTIRT